MATVSVERQAAEDRVWADWEQASAAAQNRYYRAWADAHKEFRAGGPYAGLEAATRAALAARTQAEEAALAAYWQAMRDLPQ